MIDQNINYGVMTAEQWRIDNTGVMEWGSESMDCCAASMREQPEQHCGDGRTTRGDRAHRVGKNMHLTAPTNRRENQPYNAARHTEH